MNIISGSSNEPKTQKITLDGGAEVTIPAVYEYAKCKSCGAEIIWAKTKNGKFMPVKWDEIKRIWISHFSDCKSANFFRHK